MPVSLIQNLVQNQANQFSQILMPVSQVSPAIVSEQNVSVGQTFDFEFLINIIKGLENTIKILNRRLEAYEAHKNQGANFHSNSNIKKGEESFFFLM